MAISYVNGARGKKERDNASFNAHFGMKLKCANRDNKTPDFLIPRAISPHFRAFPSRIHRTRNMENPRMIRHLTRVSMGDQMDSHYIRNQRRM